MLPLLPCRNTAIAAAGALARPVSNTVGDALSKSATVIDNFDPLNAATTGAEALPLKKVGRKEWRKRGLKPSLCGNGHEDAAGATWPREEGSSTLPLIEESWPTDAPKLRGRSLMYAQIRMAR